jgi:two-component system, chemotaxis family, sensor kinase CheA
MKTADGTPLVVREKGPSVESDPELLGDFIQEATDYIEEVEPRLIELYQDSGESVVDQEEINRFFRLFHSIKGSAGFLGLGTIAGLTHDAETLLDTVRQGQQRLSRRNVELLCRAIDQLRSLIAAIENEEAGDVDAVEELRDALQVAVTDPDAAITTTLRKGSPPPPSTPAEPVSPAEMIDLENVVITPEMRAHFVQETTELLDNVEEALLAVEESDKPPEKRVRDALRDVHSFKGSCGFMGFPQPEILSHRMETALELMRDEKLISKGNNNGVMLAMIDVLRDVVRDIANDGAGEINGLETYLNLIDEMLPEEADDPEPTQDTNQQPQTAREQSSKFRKSTEIRARERDARQSIRVDLNKVDALIDLVGELIIAETMVTHAPVVVDIEDEGLDRAKHQLRRICGDLQDIALSVRMVPLSGLFRKMVRLVHDLSKKSNKQIHLEIRGEETEVDKTVIEILGDPLVHIVRNACDHGVESIKDREAAGKPVISQVQIEGRHEGGEVWVMISDDGRGLDRNKIIAKAKQRGLVGSDADDWDDEKIFRLVFEPGFSTADQVTDISGRGVGMDVVKKNIEKLGGRIDVRSQLGQGATFILRIPLTLAIIDGMLIRVGTACYTIPTLAIRESLQPEPKVITHTPDGQELLRLREEMIPVVRLHQLFQQSCGSEALDEGILVVVEDGDEAVALFVDEILGQQQTVIKGLSSYLGKARGCSGCTILGDGTVSLILDLPTICGQVKAQVATSVG